MTDHKIVPITDEEIEKGFTIIAFSDSDLTLGYQTMMHRALARIRADAAEKQELLSEVRIQIAERDERIKALEAQVEGHKLGHEWVQRGNTLD